MVGTPIHRRSQAEIERHHAAFIKGLEAIKRASIRDRAKRFGPWLFAAHMTIGPTWKPRLDRWPGEGWSLWWLWFEVACVKPPPPRSPTMADVKGLIDWFRDPNFAGPLQHLRDYAEIDRRHKETAAALETLEAERGRLREALDSLVGGDLTYDGPFILIPAKNHADAIERVRKARAALGEGGA